MKATIKLAVGTTVDLEGTQEEVVEGIKAALGLAGLGQATIATPFVLQPNPMPVVSPQVVPTIWPPNGTIPWPGQYPCPWAPGTIIYTCGPNVCTSPGCAETAGFKVELQDNKTVLVPQGMGAIIDALTGGGMKVDFHQPPFFTGHNQLGDVRPLAAESHVVSVYGNDFDKASYECALPTRTVVGHAS